MVGCRKRSRDMMQSCHDVWQHFFRSSRRLRCPRRQSLARGRRCRAALFTLRRSGYRYGPQCRNLVTVYLIVLEHFSLVSFHVIRGDTRAARRLNWYRYGPGRPCCQVLFRPVPTSAPVPKIILYGMIPPARFSIYFVGGPVSGSGRRGGAGGITERSVE